MIIAIGYDQVVFLHKEYINSPIVTSIKITENKICEIRAVIAWMPDISFYARAHNYTIFI